jgi:hypothetical protein
VALLIHSFLLVRSLFATTAPGVSAHSNLMDERGLFDSSLHSSNKRSSGLGRNTPSPIIEAAPEPYGATMVPSWIGVSRPLFQDKNRVIYNISNLNTVHSPEWCQLSNTQIIILCLSLLVDSSFDSIDNTLHQSCNQSMAGLTVHG